MSLAACVGLLLDGCGSSDPKLYTLGQRPGPPRSGPRQVVVIRDVTVPRYLERQEMVRRKGDRLIADDDDWWGEMPSAMIRRVFAADLAQRLPSADVLATDGMAGERPDVEVELALQRFEPDGDGRVVLEGVAAMTGRARPRLLEKLAVEVSDPARTASGQVEAMNDALGRVADAVAARIAQ